MLTIRIEVVFEMVYQKIWSRVIRSARQKKNPKIIKIKTNKNNTKNSNNMTDNIQ